METKLGVANPIIVLLALSIGIMGAFWWQAWGYAPKKTAARMRTEPLHPSVETVWVMRPDGALSCSAQPGISLSRGAQELKSVNIPVLDSRKNYDGKMHLQVCGAAKGSINSFLIPRESLQEALGLGYREMPVRALTSSPPFK